MSEHKQHHYHAHCRWSGTTAVGYEAYNRAHEIAAAPATTHLQLSGDPAFRGDPAKLNPEQLLVMAASSCQLLSFLAIAARRRLDVLEYEDHAEGVMDESIKPIHINRILLKTRIVVKGPVEEAAVLKAVEMGHHECFIANSLKTEIVVEAKIEIRA